MGNEKLDEVARRRFEDGGHECPFCGSKELERLSPINDGETIGFEVHCSSCQQSWQEGYQLNSFAVKRGQDWKSFWRKDFIAEDDVTAMLNFEVEGGKHLIPIAVFETEPNDAESATIAAKRSNGVVFTYLGSSGEGESLRRGFYEADGLAYVVLKQSDAEDHDCFMLAPEPVEDKEINYATV